ncbi:transmembrane protein 225B isoform X1 [Herpailurus yagouaroundi]|uniref:transmembrane protein 225B isoform X1 n=2 Tax=Herpailurus yagouaroundi TaxID=1608482 RepID=UPI001AD760D2|nr:transmembrane protein 225B isoform X1 [Puma yagouaroundi]XP_040312231.1 transmembrane protein 225B isoform X1 [Puma yagouaroundi]
MGRPVMLTLEDKDMKGFTWAIAPALTSLGYLLILLVSIFPFWVRLVNEESHEVFFSGLFENCFHIKCWKPRPLSGSAGLCPLSRVRGPAAAQPPLPHSVHHSRPRFPAVRGCPVFPHHLHPGVLCISAVSEDPEAQFGVSLHQLPHRLAKALPWEAPITWRRWNAHSGKIRGQCLPGLVAACPGDPESEDEAQPPQVLGAVALLRSGLCHPSVHSGWCHLPLSRSSLPSLPFVAQFPEYPGDPRGHTPGEYGESGRRPELNTKGDTAEGRNNYLVQESVLRHRQLCECVCGGVSGSQFLLLLVSFLSVRSMFYFPTLTVILSCLYLQFVKKIF